MEGRTTVFTAEAEQTEHVSSAASAASSSQLKARACLEGRLAAGALNVTGVERDARRSWRARALYQRRSNPRTPGKAERPASDCQSGGQPLGSAVVGEDRSNHADRAPAAAVEDLEAADHRAAVLRGDTAP